jgi:hypothetical protein
MALKYVKRDGRNYVDVSLNNMRNADNIYWDTSFCETGGPGDKGFKRCNSYALVDNDEGPWMREGRRYDCLSINGMGEIRWEVRPYYYEGGLTDHEHEEAVVTYFGLQQAETEEKLEIARLMSRIKAKNA